MNSGYVFAWSGTTHASSVSEQQQQAQAAGAACPHFGSTTAAGAAAAAILTATTSTTNNNNICSTSQQQLQPNSPWTTTTTSVQQPDSFYDHSSLLECARCNFNNQGHFKRYLGGGSIHGQGNMTLMDGDLMQELQYNIEDEDDMCIGMEMKMMKKRKLTSEQARQLEASFEADKKLEAEKKQRLAEQLGLQPRQVAVWFQNRRARSKTKQLEIDFLTLKAEYDRVLAQRRSLQAEIARLSAQLQARSSDTKNNTCSQDSTSSTNSNNGDVVSESATLQMNMASPIEDKEGLTSNFTQEIGSNGNKEGLPRSQDLSKSPNLHSYDWEHYDNGLWVFD